MASEPLKVEYKQLGKSGLHVSVPILGAMGMGDPSWGVSALAAPCIEI
jgi:aryl-alcohol dehydrogenase-like predicted oxidoreductase